MKKIYMVPSVTVMEFVGLDVLTTSRSMGNAGSNAVDGGPSSGEAPKRRGGIWDEE